MKTRRAFTLAELVVVISIVGLLAALVLPSLTGTFTIARTRLCANNLRRIHEATQTWATEGRLWDLKGLVDGGWTSTVVAFGSKELLICPEGEELPEGTPIEQQVVIRTSPTSDVAIPLVGLLDGGGFKVLKLSQTQWQGMEGKRMEPVEYVPDGDPHIYWWGYDDGKVGSGDYDFQDLAIRVTKNGDGTATVYVTGATAGKPEVWSADLTTCYARWQEINKHHDKSAPGVTFTLGIGGRSHYGMNDALLEVRTADKIQALDYFCATAESTDDWTSPECDRDEDGRPDFFRHGGRLNVLFQDASVRPRSQRDIDPVDPQIERDLWVP